MIMIVRPPLPGAERQGVILSRASGQLNPLKMGREKFRTVETRTPTLLGVTPFVCECLSIPYVSNKANKNKM